MIPANGTAVGCFLTVGLSIVMGAPSAWGGDTQAASAGGAVGEGRATNVLRLAIDDPGERCLSPGENVTVTLSMSDLAEPVTGYQAFVQFDPEVLNFVSGQYTPTPFTLPIFNPITANPNGEIDLAAGIFPWDPPVSADADLVLLHFTANAVEASSEVTFRPHEPPARFTNPAGESVSPTLAEAARLVVTSSTTDSDGDGVVDPCDVCPCSDDGLDSDGDGFPDGCDGYGDFDHDGDVDLADFAEFVACLSGPDVEMAGGCAVFDANSDLRVDLFDFGEFQREFGRSTCP